MDSTIVKGLRVLEALAASDQPRGIRMWELGIQVVHRNQVRRAAQLYLRALHEKLGESVFLSVPDNGDISDASRMKQAGA